jgi:hypothetical protein
LRRMGAGLLVIEHRADIAHVEPDVRSRKAT